MAGEDTKVLLTFDEREAVFIDAHGRRQRDQALRTFGEKLFEYGSSSLPPRARKLYHAYYVALLGAEARKQVELRIRNHYNNTKANKILRVLPKKLIGINRSELRDIFNGRLGPELIDKVVDLVFPIGKLIFFEYFIN